MRFFYFSVLIFLIVFQTSPSAAKTFDASPRIRYAKEILKKSGFNDKEINKIFEKLKKIPLKTMPEDWITGYYGNMTEISVILLEEKYKKEIIEPLGLSEGKGIVEGKTKDKINELIKEKFGSSFRLIERDLKKGDEGDDVKTLQKLLLEENLFPPPFNWKKKIEWMLREPYVQKGVDFYKKNKELLLKLQSETGVGAEELVGLIAVETDFSESTGRYEVANVFYTKLTDPRLPAKKWKYAAQNLAAFIEYCKKGGIDNYLSIKGSSAGAFGYTQFMPQTLKDECFGKGKEKDGISRCDGDGNGKLNLFTKEDALKATALHLQSLGWNKNKAIALGKYYGKMGEYPKPSYPRAVLDYAKALREKINQNNPS